MNQIEVYLKWSTAFVASLWMGLPDLTRLLVVLMVIDILFGLAVAIRDRTLSASSAWRGVTKKLGSLGMVVVAAMISPYNPIPEISLVQAASAFYVVPELLSITRNASLLGVASFPGLEHVLKYFQGVSGQGRNENPSFPKDPNRA